MKPLRGSVLVKYIVEAAQRKSGIFLPEVAREAPQMAEVITRGDGVEDVKPGDKVIISKYGGVEIEDGLLILDEKDILAVVNE